MIKNVLRRLLSLALSFIMLIPLLAATNITALAATDVPLSGLTVDGITASYSENANDAWTASEDTINGKVKSGRVVRLEEMEHMIIYGMETRNLCKDLSTYISMKQQKNRRSKDK